jgi:hypothetical protein
MLVQSPATHFFTVSVLTVEVGLVWERYTMSGHDAVPEEKKLQSYTSRS